MISVIIPLYNKEKSITDTINSVLNQTFKDFELIIVNDGSKDNSLSVVNQFTDKRVKIIDKPNGGVSSARNVGILNAKYEYIAFLDGDDLWAPNHLTEIVKLIEFDESIFIYATQFKKIKNKEELKNNIFDTEILIVDYLDYESTTKTLFSSSSFAFNKRVLKGLDYYYNEDLKFGEDVDFWYRLSKRKKVLLSNNVTAFYFTGSENRSDYVMPIKFRFHQFDFSNKSLTEKKYLGKLVALIIIDYIMYKDYTTSFKIYKKYINQSYYIFRYVYLLVKKKIIGLV